MIVDPDFLDHWRTRMVIDALGDPMAPMYILRLWAHCQERKSDVFAMPTRGLKAQCRFGGDADAFEQALQEAGFIERDGDTIHVCGWAEKNASLLAAWENGAKGGRPRKKPNGNQRVTKQEPTGNPAVTQGEPSENPSLTHAKPIREEKRRDSVADATAGKPAKVTNPDEIIFGYGVPMLTAAGVQEKQARSFLGGLRKHHGDDAVVEALRECLKAKPLQPLDWLAASLPPKGGPPKVAPMSFAERDRKAKEARFREMAGSAYSSLLGGNVIDMEPAKDAIPTLIGNG